MKNWLCWLSSKYLAFANAFYFIKLLSNFNIAELNSLSINCNSTIRHKKQVYLFIKRISIYKNHIKSLFCEFMFILFVAPSNWSYVNFEFYEKELFVIVEVPKRSRPRMSLLFIFYGFEDFFIWPGPIIALFD